jgi:hypothetical protein
MTSTASAPSSSRGRFFAGLGLGILLGFGACYGWGYMATRYHVIEESKLCYDALKNHPDKLQSQTREYLKERLYWNAAVWVSPSWISDWQIDFGPVDDAALGDLRGIKDWSSSAQVYHDALVRQGRTRDR